MRVEAIDTWSFGSIATVITSASIYAATSYQLVFWRYFGVNYFEFVGWENLVVSSLTALAVTVFGVLGAHSAVGLTAIYLPVREDPRKAVNHGALTYAALLIGIPLICAISGADTWGGKKMMLFVQPACAILAVGLLSRSQFFRQLAPVWRTRESVALSLVMVLNLPPMAGRSLAVDAHHDSVHDSSASVLRRTDFVQPDAFKSKQGYALLGVLGSHAILMELKNETVMVVPMEQILRWRVPARGLDLPLPRKDQ